MKKHLKLMGQILLVVFALYGMFAFASQVISPSSTALADSSMRKSRKRSLRKSFLRRVRQKT